MPKNKNGRNDTKGKNVSRKTGGKNIARQDSDSASSSSDDRLSENSKDTDKRKVKIEEKLQGIEDFLPKQSEISNTHKARETQKAIKEAIGKLLKGQHEISEINNLEELIRKASIESNVEGLTVLEGRIAEIKVLIDPDEIDKDAQTRRDLQDSLKDLDAGIKDSDLALIMADDFTDILQARELRAAWLAILQNVNKNIDEGYLSDGDNKTLLKKMIEKTGGLDLIQTHEFVKEVQNSDLGNIGVDDFVKIIDILYPPLSGTIIPDGLLSKISKLDSAPGTDDIKGILAKYPLHNLLPFLNQFTAMRREKDSLSITDVLDETTSFKKYYSNYSKEFPEKAKNKLLWHFEAKSSVGAIAVVATNYTTSGAQTNANNPHHWYLDFDFTRYAIIQAHGGVIHSDLLKRIEERLKKLVTETKKIIERNSGKTFDQIIEAGGNDGQLLIEIKRNGTPGMHAEVIAANQALMDVPPHIKQGINDIILAVMQPKKPSEGELAALGDDEQKIKKLKEDLAAKKGQDKPCCANCSFILSGSSRYKRVDFNSASDKWPTPTKVSEENG